jgi:hypothetical protein
MLPLERSRWVEVLSTTINPSVVAAVGLVLAWLGKGRFAAQDRRTDQLERRIDSLQASVEGMRSALQTSLEAMRSDLQASVDAMRSDLTQVALAVGVSRRATNS